MNDNTLKIGGYEARIGLDEDTFYGRILGIDAVITFEGRTHDELKQAFQDTLKDYLELCELQGRDPQRSYSGQFRVRISPEAHRAAANAAEVSNMSLNKWVSKAINAALEPTASAS